MKKIVSMMALVAVILCLAVSVSAATGYSREEAVDINVNQNYIKAWSDSNYWMDHYVRFTTPADGIVTFCYEKPTNKNGDPLGYIYALYTSTGELVWETGIKDCPQMDPAATPSVGLPAGTYYLNTRPSYTISRGTFNCNCKVEFVADDYAEKEPNDAGSSATIITPGYTYTGFVGDNSNDRDSFRFYVDSPKTVTIVIDNFEALLDNSATFFFFEAGEAGIEAMKEEFVSRGDGTYALERRAVEGYNQFTLYATGFQTKYTITVEVPEFTGWQNNGGKWYFYKDNGDMVTGWLSDGGSWYYMNADGAMVTGWLYYGGVWYYMNRSGVMQTGWVQQGSTWYYLNAFGMMVTGWQNVGGQWYYFNTSGKMVTGWQNVGGQWYYFRSSGEMATGWQNLGGQWYYFNTSGKMVTGWQNVGGQWYYFNTSGKIVTGWKNLDGQWYYFRSSGEMATGWQNLDGQWYYFRSSGEMVTGWKNLDGQWYYFRSSGEMVTGTQKISGVTYVFNSSGIWVG